jgi:hypothetical protein
MTMLDNTKSGIFHQSSSICVQELSQGRVFLSYGSGEGHVNLAISVERKEHILDPWGSVCF